MTEPVSTPEPKRRGAFTRFLDGVEWLGNLLPHPVTLFAILAVGIVLLSGLFGWL
ncbi:AbgT family transporter, partial [uncultured Maricaulis sp.]